MDAVFYRAEIVEEYGAGDYSHRNISAKRHRIEAFPFNHKWCDIWNKSHLYYFQECERYMRKSENNLRMYCKSFL